MPSLPVRHIFFDLGNILVGLRSGEKLRALAKSSGQTVEAFCERIWSHDQAHDYERGHYSCRDYFDHLAAELNLQHAIPGLQEAFCDIFHPLPERVAIAHALAQRYPLALISNTCAAHIRHLEAHFDFFPLFHPRIYSHEVGSRKPHPKIYEDAIRESGALPEQSLFIDDLAENLTTPARMGWHTLHLPPGTDLESSLRQFGIEIS